MTLEPQRRHPWSVDNSSFLTLKGFRSGLDTNFGQPDNVRSRTLERIGSCLVSVAMSVADTGRVVGGNGDYFR